jgi:hypothetical protein
MSDTIASHEDLDKYCRELPKSIIAPLPDSIEKREALRLVDIMADLVHEARERKADR